MTKVVMKSSLRVVTMARAPVETSRKSDTSKYRCTAGRGGAACACVVEAMAFHDANTSERAQGGGDAKSLTAWRKQGPRPRSIRTFGFVFPGETLMLGASHKLHPSGPIARAAALALLISR
jgi:hypothetical protein